MNPLKSPFNLFYYPPDLIRILNQFLQIIVIFFFNAFFKFCQLCNMFVQYIQHIFFVLHKDRHPHGRITFCQAEPYFQNQQMPIQKWPFLLFLFPIPYSPVQTK